MPVIIDGTNGISGVDGSASTPAVQGTDTNTGMFFPTADTIAFAEGGTEVMRIDSSGNLRVGSSNTALNSINSINTFGFKNRLINGGFQVWQRGTSFSTQVYTADRWVATNGTSLTITQSTDVPVGFKYSLSITGTGFPSIVQRIESLNCTDLAGQSITISFWAKQTSGASAESLGIILYYPTAGADNYGGGSTQIASAVFTGTTGWVYYSYTVPAASMVSATANGLQIQFYGNTTGAATYLITGVQLEKGSTATSFDYRPYGTELALCQRYYQKLTAGTGVYTCFGSGTTASTTTTIAYVKYSTPMRASPTASFSTLAIQIGTGAIAAVSSFASSFLGLDSAYISIVNASTTAGAAAVLISNNSTSGYIDFSAEL